LGWLNPWIYKHPEIFNDIFEGRNPGEKPNGCVGFPAGKGWVILNKLILLLM